MDLLNKNKKKTGWATFKLLILIMSLALAHFFINQPAAQAQDTLNQLNEQIQDRQQEINQLQEQIDAYAKKVKEISGQAKTLQNQIAILQNQIAKINLDIEATGKRIEASNLEIQALNLTIQQTEAQIADRKEKISEFIRLINRQDQVSLLEVLLTQNSFSEIYDYFKNTEQLNGDVKKTLDKLKDAKNQLELEKSNLEATKQQEENLKDDLLQQKADLDERTFAQQILFGQTKLNQRQYQQQVNQLQLEQQQVNADVANLEKKVRQELEQRQEAERFKNFGPARLAWPIDPSRGITAFFHDPDYPFRYLFEHPAIDIRTPQGTTIKAPEAGYVGRVQFKGNSSYGYIVIIHNDGLSTVYGHISKPLVGEDQFVAKGDPIALSGGLPGSPGSGNLSTGAHLHFEVRVDGIPVNPLEYLPAY